MCSVWILEQIATFPCTILSESFLQLSWRVFTVRYDLGGLNKTDEIFSLK
jgi:hypothetical protein